MANYDNLPPAPPRQPTVHASCSLSCILNLEPEHCTLKRKPCWISLYVHLKDLRQGTLNPKPEGCAVRVLLQAAFSGNLPVAVLSVQVQSLCSCIFGCRHINLLFDTCEKAVFTPRWYKHFGQSDQNRYHEAWITPRLPMRSSESWVFFAWLGSGLASRCCRTSPGAALKELRV